VKTAINITNEKSGVKVAYITAILLAPHIDGDGATLVVGIMLLSTILLPKNWGLEW